MRNLTRRRLAYSRVLDDNESLSADEERRLVDACLHHPDGRLREDARKRLLLSHQRLVYSIVAPYAKRTRGVELDDLLAEGNLGLLDAMPRFDPSRGTRFGTYAKRWVRNYVLSYVRASMQKGLVDESRLTRKLFLSYEKVRQRIEQEIASAHAEIPLRFRDETDCCLADYFDTDIDKIKEHESIFCAHHYFDTTSSCIEGERPEKKGIAGNAHDPSDDIDKKKMIPLLARAYAALNPQEKDILSRRFGIGKDLASFEQESFGQIATDYAMTGPGIRYIEQQAIRKLRASLETILCSRIE